MYRQARWIIKGLCARHTGVKNGLPGAEYDTFGRIIALREIVKKFSICPAVVSRLANPISCVRYFEFEYAGKNVKKLMQREIPPETVLDISSPRLFPFWMVEKAGLYVHMINPDRADLDASRHAAVFVRNNNKLEFLDDVDATRLPFIENSFDLATSISVIEHIPDNGDSRMISDLARVVRPGGRIILTFPVRPEFSNEYREKNLYYRKQDSENDGKYFFQRFYDYRSIAERILAAESVVEEDREYWIEKPAGWFDNYEKKWIKEGLELTLHDPELMSAHFAANGSNHPGQEMGICCMTLTVNKQA